MGGNELHSSPRSHTQKKKNEWPERKRRNKDKIVGTTQRNIKQTRMERERDLSQTLYQLIFTNLTMEKTETHICPGS